MIGPARVTLLALLLFSWSCCVNGAKAGHVSDLLFRLRPTTPAFEVKTAVKLEFSLKNVSDHRVLAIRQASLNDLIYLRVVDERGRRINWQGKIVSRAYPADLFVVLEPGQVSTFRAVISLSNGSGYRFDRAGIYRVRAEFSLAPKEYFAPVSKGAAIPDRPVKSNWAQFLINTPPR
jgi:hypothetical protein